MLKLSLALALFTTLGLSLTPLDGTDERDAVDRTAVERAVRDYVEGVYNVKPELIVRSVHPALEKLGLYRPGDAPAYRTPSKMTYDQLVELSKGWNKDGREGQDLAYEVQVLDILDVTASAKLTAKWGIDFMHLAKSGGEWKIVQILWQSHPPKP